jgi:hypothetical protein
LRTATINNTFLPIPLTTALTTLMQNSSRALVNACS